MKDDSSILKLDHAPMSQGDFKSLGREDVGYVKEYTVNGKIVFVLHAADGVALAVQNTQDAAFISADHHDLDVISIH
jgi:hypothetical protein